MKIKFYQKNRGNWPVMDFLEKLSSEENARITACLENIETLGFDSPSAPSNKFLCFMHLILRRTLNVLPSKKAQNSV